MRVALEFQINGAVVTTFFELETAVDAALPASGGTGSVSMVLDRSGERVEVNSRVSVAFS